MWAGGTSENRLTIIALNTGSVFLTMYEQCVNHNARPSPDHIKIPLPCAPAADVWEALRHNLTSKTMLLSLLSPDQHLEVTDGLHGIWAREQARSRKKTSSFFKDFIYF